MSDKPNGPKDSNSVGQGGLTRVDRNDGQIVNNNYFINLKPPTDGTGEAESSLPKEIEGPSGVGGVAVTDAIFEVEIIINKPFGQFTSDDEQKLLKKMKSVLDGEEGSLRIRARRPGSTKLVFNLTPEQAERLAWAIRSGEFDSHSVTGLNVVKQRPARKTAAVSKIPASPNTLVQDLIEAGIHFGQRASCWNPQMARYIWGKRNGLHIIDIKETIKGLMLAKKFISKIVSEGKDVCFVGTKRQARSVLELRVPEVGMHYVGERWLGGTLTNFRTIRSRLARLEELDAIERRDNFASYSKKMESMLRREQQKIKRNLEGIRRMDKLPGAIVAIDVSKEANALREARKLGIPTVCLIDTDGNPELADIPIPGNDDSMRSIDLIVRELCLAIKEGRAVRNDRLIPTEGDKAIDSAAPRRSRRAQFRADEAVPPGQQLDSESGEGEGSARVPLSVWQ